MKLKSIYKTKVCASLNKILIGLGVISSVFVANLGANNMAFAGVYSIARGYVGLHEKKHTSRLKKSIGVNPRRTPWCGAFVGSVAKRAGKRVPSGHLRALNWRGVGRAVTLKNARKGDVVVVRTKYGHHVGFYSSVKNGRVQLLGGNQSNQVKISNYRIRSIVSIRRL